MAIMDRKSTDVTYDDIILWKALIERARNADTPEELAKVVECLWKDMCFLVLLVESMLKIDVDQDVYDRARAMQRGEKE